MALGAGGTAAGAGRNDGMGAEPYTSPVGSFAANAYGLYDMTGNVGEFCFEWHPSYLGSRRVRHGGGWGSYADGCRIGDRRSDPPGNATNDIGFRAVLLQDQP